MKIKAKFKKGVLKVKAMAKHPMITYAVAKKKGVKPNFITMWTAKIGDEMIFEMSSSQFLSKNPIVKFKSRAGKKGEKIEMTWVDLLGKTKTKKVKIK
ncbi:MAG: thiosulfate oxidation carrier complex protein SoxZ [Proteobacteria bacterium]|nr:MAG: thiosulfate oxidation carrier complex protein SoxZ [Pseudomonadota bacterium]